MADAKLKILMDLEDRVSGEMNKIKTGLDDFKGKVDSLTPSFEKMRNIGVVGFTAIAGAVGLSLNSYADAERAQRQLEHSILDISKGSKDQVAAISDLSDALQTKSGIDGDALKMGAAQLSTFGLQSKSVVDLTKSLADLTVNQNGVNATSDQYVQSANTIAKALQGQFGVLEKSGIRFTEQQQAMILNGTEAQKVAALQEGLAQNLRETTDTMGGVDAATAKASRSFGEIMETLGKSFAPLLSQISDAIVPVMTSFNEWAQANPEMVKTIVLVTGGLFALLAVVGSLGLVIGPIVAGFSAIAGALAAITLPGLAIVALLAIIGGAIYYLASNWQMHVDNMKWAFGIMSEYVQGVMQSIADFFSAVWTTIKDIFWTSVDFLIGAWVTLLNFLFPGWQEAFMGILKVAQEIFGAISSFLSSAWTTIKNLFTGGLAAVKTAWSSVWGSVRDTFQSIWDTIKSVAKSAFDWIKDGIDKLMGPLQTLIDLAQKAWAAAKNVGANVSAGVSSIVATGKSITGKAVGGPVYAGDPYVVGENGPEMFVPNSSGRIIPNGGMGSGGLVLNVTITGNSFMGREGIADQIGNDILRALKREMKIS